MTELPEREEWYGIATANSATRQGQAISLLVLRPEPRPIETALAAYVAGEGPCPNYHIAADGLVTLVVDEDRAASFVGIALWESRWRNIDRIGVSVALEVNPDGRPFVGQLAPLHDLIGLLKTRHEISDDHVVTVDPTSPADDPVIIASYPPPPPLDEAATSAVDDGFLLGGSDEEALWRAIYAESLKRRGGDVTVDKAFGRYAAKLSLGAALGPNEPQRVIDGNESYNYQVFARDLVYNPGDRWSAVGRLGDLVKDGKMPAEGSLAFKLLSAAYESAQRAGAPSGVQGVGGLKPAWGFHQMALKEGLGFALTGNQPIGEFRVQAFAGEVFYHPTSNPRDTRRLSATPASDPAFNAIWAALYQQIGASFEASNPFFQRAVALKIGPPLGDLFQIQFEGAAYTVQVFALDTLFAGPDGNLRRLSEVATPAFVLNWNPAPLTPPAPPAPPPPAANQPPGDRSKPDWPARPNFGILLDPKRAQLLGNLEWVLAPTPTNREAIRITNGWDQQHIVDLFIPQLKGFRSANAGNLKFHKAAAEQMRRLWEAWERAGLLHLVKTFDGAWVPRTIRGNTTRLSNHAYGTAFDINAVTNPFKPNFVPPLVGQNGSVRELVGLANEHGFYWGGHWGPPWANGWSDGMHFEWARP